jgi:hypothetical protein
MTDWGVAKVVSADEVFELPVLAEGVHKVVAEVRDLEEVELLAATAAANGVRLTLVWRMPKPDAVLPQALREVKGVELLTGLVPGVIGTNVKVVKAAIVRLHADAPSLKCGTPRVVKAPDIKDTKVMRFRAVRTFTADDATWRDLVNDPTTALQMWARDALKDDVRAELISVFHVFHEAGAGGADPRIRGLVRVRPSAIAKLVPHSGKIVAGRCFFLEPYSWTSDASVAEFDVRPELEYVKRLEGEDPMCYLARCRDDAGRLGLTVGLREVARRRDPIPGTSRPAVWKMSGVPRYWSSLNVEKALEEAGFKDVEVLGRPYSHKDGMVWRVKATAADAEGDFVPLQINDKIIELTRARQQARPRTTYGVRAKQWSFEEASVAGPAAGSVAKDASVPSESAGPGGAPPPKKPKRDASSGAASEKEGQKSAEGAKPPAEKPADKLKWLEDMTLKKVPGDGTCCWASLAGAFKAKGICTFSADKVRSTVAATLRKNEDVWKPFWDKCEPTEQQKPLESWETYCTMMDKRSAWGGDLEVAAAAAKWNVPIVIVKPGGFQVHNRSGKHAAVVLTYASKHYDYYEGDVPAEILHTAEKGKPTCERGGGRSRASVRSARTSSAVASAGRSSASTPRTAVSAVRRARSSSAASARTPATARTALQRARGGVQACASECSARTSSAAASARRSSASTPPTASSAVCRARSASAASARTPVTARTALQSVAPPCGSRAPSTCASALRRATRSTASSIGQPEVMEPLADVQPKGVKRTRSPRASASSPRPRKPQAGGKQEWECPLCGWKVRRREVCTAKTAHLRTLHADERAAIKLMRCRKDERMVIPSPGETVVWQCPCCPKAIVDTGTEYTVRHLNGLKLAHRRAEHAEVDRKIFRTTNPEKKARGIQSMRTKLKNRYAAKTVSETLRSDHLLRPFPMVRPWVDELKRRRGQPVYACTTWACGTCRRMGKMDYFRRVRCTPKHAARNTAEATLDVLRKALKKKKWAQWWPEIANEIRFKEGEDLNSFLEFKGIVQQVSQTKVPSSSSSQ